MIQPQRMFFRTALRLFADVASLMSSAMRPRTQLSEDVFLRKQPALYPERQVKPRADDATRRAPGHRPIPADVWQLIAT
jgi:hypothetical protein